MAPTSACLLVACLLMVSGAAAQTTKVTVSVIFGGSPPLLKLDRARFASAFKLGFSESVALAGCLASAPAVTQSITYSSNGAVIVFDYPTSAMYVNAVALVVAAPANWFSLLDASLTSTQVLFQYLTPSPPGGFLSSSSVPELIAPASGGCSSPSPSPSPSTTPTPNPAPTSTVSPPASPPPMRMMPPPAAANCTPTSTSFSTAFKAAAALNVTQQADVLALFPAVLLGAVRAAGATNLTATAIGSVTASFNATTLVFTTTFILTLPCTTNATVARRRLLQDTSIAAAIATFLADPTYYLLQANAAGRAFASLGGFTSAVVTNTSPPPPPMPTVPPPTPQLPSGYNSPPPPFFTTPNIALQTTITFTGDYTLVAAHTFSFTRQLQAVVASLFCTGFANVTVAMPAAAPAGSTTAFTVALTINYNTAVSYGTDPSTCGTFSFVSLSQAFSGKGFISAYARIKSQDPSFVSQWGPITAGVVAAGAAMVNLPSPSPPPPMLPLSPSPPPPPPPQLSPPSPPMYPASPPMYSAGTYPSPRPAPPMRRLIESNADSVKFQFGALESTDVVYGADKVLYEVFAETATYYEAGAICNTRGGSLVTYVTEAAQVFVDILCETAGMACWVEGNSAGRCSAVTASRLQQVPCSTRQHFVCATAQA